MSKKHAPPVRYSRKIADEILDRIADGELLGSICTAPYLPDQRTVRRWAIDDRDGFRDRYEQATRLGYDAMLEEGLELVRDAEPDQVPARKEYLTHLRWMGSKIAPNRYGDSGREAANAEKVLEGANITFNILPKRERAPEPVMIEAQKAEKAEEE